MINLKPIDLDDAINELERELEVRSTVYPKWIKQRKYHRSDLARKYKALQFAIKKLKELKS